jgi:hypothetical protein
MVGANASYYILEVVKPFGLRTWYMVVKRIGHFVSQLQKCTTTAKVGIM